MPESLPEQTQTVLEKAGLLAEQSGKKAVSTSCFLLAVAELHPEIVNLVIPDLELPDIKQGCKRLLRISDAQQATNLVPLINLSGELQRTLRDVPVKTPLKY